MKKNLLTLLLLMTLLPLHAQKLAVGIDGAWLAAGMFDGGAEMAVGRATTLNLSVLACQHPWVHHDIAGIAFQPELRYYLSGRTMYHHFVGVGAIVGGYDLTVNQGRYQGAAAGIGVTFGYVVALSPHWSLDLHSGLGVIHSEDRWNGHDNYTIPTKGGITIAYIIR